MRTWSESLFILSYLKYVNTAKFTLPTVKQDMFEHWDVDVDGLKFEVKGRKRVNRNDKEFTDDIHVEIINVNGDKGWIQGLANTIALEREKDFLLVSRRALYKLVVKKLKNEYGKGYYQKHSRPGRRDLVTLIPLADVLLLQHNLIPKL